MIIVEGLTKRYNTAAGPLCILEGASFRLGDGEKAVILGPSGSGKSTLLNMLGTLDPPTRGSFTLDGENPYALGERALAAFRNQRIGFVFQDHHLLPQLTLLENVLLPTLAIVDPAAISIEEAEKRAAALLARVGLSQRGHHHPGQVSGGERQRAALARALINKPTLILADEPTGNLDGHTAKQVSDLLLDLQKQEGFMLLVVTHSDTLAARFERRFEIRDGKLNEE